MYYLIVFLPRRRKNKRKKIFYFYGVVKERCNYGFPNYRIDKIGVKEYNISVKFSEIQTNKQEKRKDMSYRRFNELLKSHETTVYRVAKETGISASTFTDWKNGRSVPKADKMRKIADYFGVSLDMLLGSSEATGGESYARGKRTVPVIGEIRAGSPIITNETLLGREAADVDDVDEHFFLKVRGDSMKNIGMVEGSLVLFRKQQYAEEGDIVACLVGGECATVKRFSRNKKTVLLIPENEEYSPIKLSTDDFESGEARILGVALEVKIKL